VDAVGVSTDRLQPIGIGRRRAEDAGIGLIVRSLVGIEPYEFTPFLALLGKAPRRPAIGIDALGQGDDARRKRLRDELTGAVIMHSARHGPNVAPLRPCRVGTGEPLAAYQRQPSKEQRP
jgi:hypothetical protein